MKRIKNALCAVLAASAATAFADVSTVPVVSNVVMTQASSRLVTITYELGNAPAIVTLDVETNGVSIGGANISCLDGDVNKIVSENGSHTITWRPDISWPDHKIRESICRAAVRAWTTDYPPDVMVVELSSVNNNDRLSFYESLDFLPGGILVNKAYRQSRLVMKKIHAKNVEWTMGEVSGVSDNPTHPVKLADDYYIGVFPVTVGQWRALGGAIPDGLGSFGMMYPITKACCPSTIRENATWSSTAQKAYQYPNAPYESSYLGLLRKLVSQHVLFDLPSEAQWEYACRAGNGSGTWGDGSKIMGVGEDAEDVNLSKLGRYIKNVNDGVGDGSKNFVDVGCYKPNDWGLYDMYGDVAEWCLDKYQADITGNYSGAPIVNDSQSKYVLRSGIYWQKWVQNRPSYRSSQNGAYNSDLAYGFRVVAPVALNLGQ